MQYNIDGCEFNKLENLLLFRSTGSTTGNGLYFGSFSGLSYVTSMDIEIVGAFKAVEIANGNDRFFSHMWLRGNNTVSSMGIDVNGSGGDWFSDIDVVQFNYGVRLQNSSWAEFHNVLADTNTLYGYYFTGPTNNGILLDSCWAATNGIANNNARGMKIDSADGLTISNPRIANNGGHGIELGTSVANIQISGGWIAGNSYATPGASHGIVTNIGLTGGFRIQGVRSGQTAGEGNSQGYGIFINSGNDNFIVTDNDLRSNVLGGISNGSSTTASEMFVNGGIQ